MAQRKKLDAVDKALLNRLQDGFPIEPRPYKKIGEELGIDESEVLERLEALIDCGIIRSIGGTVASDKIGRFTALAATKVPGEKIEQAVSIINSYPEVTHNYERDHEYNIWFTINAESREKAEEIISNIKSKAGLDEIQLLPALKTYKIKVKFDL
ncbi:MAG: AsnC family transcriptional regulator [Chloroflexi bacterium]|nr:AsnC family transcriptional regulator [Chloroflexota bacterium]